MQNLSDSHCGTFLEGDIVSLNHLLRLEDIGCVIDREEMDIELEIILVPKVFFIQSLIRWL